MYYRSNVNNAFRTIHKCSKHFKDIPGCFDVATEIKKQIEDFKPFIPLIQGLRNQGMRNRHWEQVCVCMYVCVCVCCVCVLCCVCVCTCVLCTCVYTYVYEYAYIRICTCMYIHTQMNIHMYYIL